jgi:hypothetical protein
VDKVFPLVDVRKKKPSFADVAKLPPAALTGANRIPMGTKTFF